MMHDKVVRRRRAVLAVLVLLSLFLLTAYFGEGNGGALHGVQRGAMEVFAPIQEGANRALKPFRDLFGWFGDTLDAKGENKKLKAQNEQLQKDLVAAEEEKRALDQYKGLQEQNEQGGLDDYSPVNARVIARSPSSWYQTFQINKGSSDGLRVDQPVVNGAGLVGKVKSVSDGNAVVMLLTDPEFGVSAKTLESGEPGSVGPAVGAPGDLRFEPRMIGASFPESKSANCCTVSPSIFVNTNRTSPHFSPQKVARRLLKTWMRWSGSPPVLTTMPKSDGTKVVASFRLCSAIR